MIRVATFLNILRVATTPIQAFHNTRIPLLHISHRVMIKIGNEAAASCTPGGKCLPCESLDKSHLLSPEQIESELASMKLWSLKEGNKISRTFTARNFQCAMDSLVDIGNLAERENHHPDLHLTDYRNVEIVLYTHTLGGITSNDIALAKMIDAEVKFDYSPLWVKNHADALS